MSATARLEGLRVGEEHLLQDEAPFEYVSKHVRPQRESGRTTREEWWLHERPREKMRRALEGMTRYLVTTRHVKHVFFAWVEAGVLPDSALIVFAREDDYFFGVLHSRAHELWARRQGGQLREAESGFRYTPETCFRTFPFPEPTDEERSNIEMAAKRLDQLRRNRLEPEEVSETELKERTLTNLYNARPTWLADAHDVLDRAVFTAYGWPPDLSDEDILKNLLALNLEQSNKTAQVGS